MSINIAIDGPAGAGKSTIARRLAGELSFIYVDTGAMYRAMALYFCRLGTDPADTKQVAALCRSADIGISYENGEQIVLLEGENVNAFLRTEEVSAMASSTVHTAGRTSQSTTTLSLASMAASRVSAITAATLSPTWRALRLRRRLS